jgi:hypothetical protein
MTEIYADSVYYNQVQEELLLKRKQLSNLLSNKPSILGNYYEELLRFELKRFIPKKFTIATGAIFYSNRVSRQLDIIFYDNNETFPLFSTNNLILTAPDDVKLVIEVKSALTTTSLKEAIENLRSAIDVQIPSQSEKGPLKLKLHTMIVAFTTDLNLDRLSKKCKSEGIFEVIVFAKRNGEIIPDQFERLITSIGWVLKSGSKARMSDNLLKEDKYLK